MKNILVTLLVAVIAIIATRLPTQPVGAQGRPEMVTICHAAGQVGTLQYVTLAIPYNAAFGQAGHFNEDGTPQAGHENDYLGECVDNSASPSPSASVSPSPSIDPSPSPELSPSPSPSESASPTPTPTPTPTPGNNNNNNNNDSGSSSNNSSNNSTEPAGEILGAYAETGVVEDAIMNALGYVGGLMSTIGSAIYGKKKSKK